jgi:hypothetical protein
MHRGQYSDGWPAEAWWVRGPPLCQIMRAMAAGFFLIIFRNTDPFIITKPFYVSRYAMRIGKIALLFPYYIEL